MDPYTSAYFKKPALPSELQCSKGSDGSSGNYLSAPSVKPGGLSNLTLVNFQQDTSFIPVEGASKKNVKRGKCQRQNNKRKKDDSNRAQNLLSEPRRDSLSEESEFTPLQLQFLELKNKHPDVILMIETGYLYRLFDKDAEIASKELHFTTNFRHNMLTTSLPCQTLHIHISRLAAKGYKIGVVRKTESALMKAAGNDRNCIFKRELVALYTKSTLIGEEVDPVESSYDNIHHIHPQTRLSTYLLCLYEVPKYPSCKEVRIGVIAVCPLSGDLIYDCFFDNDERNKLQNMMKHLRPAEFLIPETQLSDETERVIMAYVQSYMLDEGVRVEKIPDGHFKYDTSKVSLKDFFETQRSNDGSNLTSYLSGCPPPVVCCLGAIFEYLKAFKLEGVLTLIKNMKTYCPNQDCLYLDADTMQALGLFQAHGSPSEVGSLFWLLDKTITAFGSRILRKWLSQPLTENVYIQQRLDAVKEIRNQMPEVISSMQVLLSKMPDLESGITSIFYKKCSTKKYWKTITSLIHIKTFIESMHNSILSLECKYLRELFLSAEKSLQGVEYLRNNLDREAAWNGYKNRLFRDVSQHQNLLSITKDIESTKEKLNGLLPEIALLLNRTKVEYSQFAEKEYVIIVKSSGAAIIPADWIIVAQTSKKICCRTAQMDSLAKKMKLLKEHYKYECHLAWLEYLEKFKPFFQHFRNAIQNLGKIDCLMGFAALAKSDDYIMPVLTCSSQDACIQIEEGRHPVLEKMLEADKQAIPNNTLLSFQESKTSCTIISGANMGGKSAYLRSVALTIIMCQIGSFVPATMARIYPLEAIYARSGVRDNIMQGKSSFGVEAGKVAEIFQGLPKHSLVLLDEFGQCTSDADGIALCYGVLKLLITKVGCLCLVVTQFPEITKLGAEFPSKVKNHHMSTFVDNDLQSATGAPEVTYLYKLVDGVGERGYAMKVCLMAGIQDSVVRAAAAKSQEMEDACEKSRLAMKLFRKVNNEFGPALLDCIQRVKDQWPDSGNG